VRYLADVHISPLTIHALRTKGYEILRVTEFLRPTATDREIINLARRQEAVIITADLDFSALIATSGEARPSVVSLRLAFPTPDRITTVLEQVLPRIQQDLERGVIASVDESSVRIRQLPIIREGDGVGS
jgi:predicted nuclease of predicted toxin-antitoxin system